MTKAKKRASRQAKGGFGMFGSCPAKFEVGQAVWTLEQIQPWDKYLSRFYLTVERDTGGPKLTVRTPTGKLRRVERCLLALVSTPQQRAAMKRQQDQLQKMAKVLAKVIEDIRLERSQER
jgi:hypothetical protein